jgi:Fe-S-cluster-containing dehydrogenase component
MGMGFFINNENCYGCKTCVIACKNEKQSGKDVRLRTVSTFAQTTPENALSFVSMACNHCENPACLANCPVGAFTKQENGVVTQNHAVCIGCNICIEVCPFTAPCLDEAEGKVYKCVMCISRLEAGLQQDCVQACPGNNLEVDLMENLLANHPDAIDGDEGAGTDPNFVLLKDPKLAQVDMSKN